MKTITICAMALAAAYVVGFSGGARAAPKTPLHCHMVPGSCVTKRTTCAPQPHVSSAQGPGKQVPCVPKTYQSCAPSKKVCDQS
jgi:hypothetical protein